MRLYYMAWALVAFGAIMLVSEMLKDRPSDEYIERIGLEAQEEINLHYANTVMTGMQDDTTLQVAIDRYKKVLPRGSQPLALIEEIEQTYPNITGKRCMLQTTSAACRRYLEAVEPFIYK